MTRNDHSIDFASEAEFMAHAQALEQELSERYKEIADSLEVHNNPAVAELFHRLADRGESHAGKLIRAAQDIKLPQIPPWEYRWLNQGGPENCMQDAHYQMTPTQALQLAMRIERCAYNFYSLTAEGSSDPQILKLAIEMLNSKQGHLQVICEWLQKTSDLESTAPEDLDPPHMPE